MHSKCHDHWPEQVFSKPHSLSFQLAPSKLNAYTWILCLLNWLMMVGNRLRIWLALRHFSSPARTCPKWPTACGSRVGHEKGNIFCLVHKGPENSTCETSKRTDRPTPCADNNAINRHGKSIEFKGRKRGRRKHKIAIICRRESRWALNHGQIFIVCNKYHCISGRQRLIIPFSSHVWHV